MVENEYLTDDEYIEKYMRDEDGNFLKLVVSPLVNESDFPAFPDFPNASKYVLQNGEGDYIYFNVDTVDPDDKLDPHEGIRIRESIIIALKKIYGITDPWDNDPDYFKSHKPIDAV